MAIDKKTRALLFPKIGKWSMIVFALLLLVAGVRAFELFGYIFKENVKKDAVIYIPSDASFEDVEALLIEQDLLYNMKAFSWVSKKKEYKKNIKPGKYELKKGWNTNQLLNVLRGGMQDPVDVTFNNVRTFEELAGKVNPYFEADSMQLLATFTSEKQNNNYPFGHENFMAMFIPNTYEFYWTNSPEQFVERMYKEYQRFWNDSRKKKAEELGLSLVEVSTLASIVQEESVKGEERPVIAGLYLNRLKRGMLLQADPTIKFAIGDFTVRRITNAMLEIDSPYNTYKYAGLPPGPINFPEITSIDAVLNAKEHNFLYMCAREDFSGYHHFARTLSEHNRNAARYRQALNRNRIWK